METKLNHEFFQARKQSMVRWLRSSNVLAAFSIVLVLSTSCTEKSLEDALQGQVFISRRNGESVELGSIPVIIVDSNSAKATLQQLRENAERQIEVQRQAITASEVQKRRRQELDAKRQLFEKAWLVLTVGSPDFAEATRLTGISDPKKIRENLNELRRESQQWWIEERVANEAADRARNLVDALSPPKCYFTTNYPGTHRIVTTDSHGIFHASVPKAGNWSVIAFGTRVLGAESVNLFWLIPIPDQHRTNMLLNSSNLFREQ